MNKPEIKRTNLLYPELSYQIIGCAYEVFKVLGYGHSEKVYQKAMAVLFHERKMYYKEQVYFPVKFHDKIIGKKFLDFLIEEKIINKTKII